MRLDVDLDLDARIPVHRQTSRMAKRSTLSPLVPAGPATRRTEAQPTTAAANARSAVWYGWHPKPPKWVGRSQLVPPRAARVDSPFQAHVAALVDVFQLSTAATNGKLASDALAHLLPSLPYFVPPFTQGAIESGALRYILDDDDIQWCIADGVPMAATARIITQLELGYARELTHLFEAETSHGRAFSERTGGLRGASIPRRPTTAARDVVSALGRESRLRRRSGIDPCQVCSAPLLGPGVAFGDPLTCIRCGASGHSKCLAVANAPQQSSGWQCDRCWVEGEDAASNAVTCALCRTAVSGPLVEYTTDDETTHRSWVHVICARMAPQEFGQLDKEHRIYHAAEKPAGNSVSSTPSKGGTSTPNQIRKRSSKDSKVAEGPPCFFCHRHASSNDLLVRCAAPKCDTQMHPACAALHHHVEARVSLAESRSSRVQAMTIHAFCASHLITRDLRSGVYSQPLDARLTVISSLAERNADEGLENNLEQNDMQYQQRVATHWRRRRERRRDESGALAARIRQGEATLIQGLGRYEIVRRCDDGVLGLSAILCLIPELQLLLSRRMEGEMWTPLVFTTESVARLGLDTQFASNPRCAVFPIGVDDDAEPSSPSIRYDENDEAEILPALRRLADSTALLCALSENIKTRELAKAAAVEAELTEIFAVYDFVTTADERPAAEAPLKRNRPERQHHHS
jgi:hypothetical protein